MIRWVVILCVALLCAVPVSAAAQATPEVATVKELAVTVAAAGVAGLPNELAAGRYRVAFTNDSAAPAAFLLVQIPDGGSLDALAVGVATAMNVMDRAATPVAGGEDPMAGQAWLNETGLSGGPGAMPGETSVATSNLTPGEWAVADDFNLRSLAGAPIVTVTGEAMPTDAAAPPTDVTMLETGQGGEGFFFELQGTLQVGPQTIEIANASDQPHFVEFVRLPGPATEEDLLHLFMGDPMASPEPDALNPEDFVLAAYASAQPIGNRQWLEVDLEPGTYAIACWIPDPLAGGIPHALEGMTTVIEVGDDAATPVS